MLNIDLIAYIDNDLLFIFLPPKTHRYVRDTYTTVVLQKRYLYSKILTTKLLSLISTTGSAETHCQVPRPTTYFVLTMMDGSLGIVVKTRRMTNAPGYTKTFARQKFLKNYNGLNLNRRVSTDRPHLLHDQKLPHRLLVLRDAATARQTSRRQKARKEETGKRTRRNFDE